MSFIDDVVIEGEIEIGDSELKAIYDCQEIGAVSFKVIPDNEEVQTPAVAYPYIANVNVKYQKRGVATKIIERAREEVKAVFAADRGHFGNSDEIHYSNEGLQLKNSCERKGITEKEEI